MNWTVCVVHRRVSHPNHPIICDYPLYPSHAVRADDAGKRVTVKTAADGVVAIELKKGEEVLLYEGDKMPRTTVSPVAADPAQCNFYGGKK